MRTAFWKMHGAGNDFVILDDRALAFPCSDAALLRRLAHRGRGIGAEGVILLQPSATADIRMRFFNPDGCEADLCGNGARCVARLARAIGIGADGQTVSIETAAGVLRAAVRARDVEIEMPDPRDWRQPLRLTVGARTLTCAFLNTGVPHVVFEEDGSLRDWGADPVAVLAPLVRRHDAFAPAGANVDFFSVTGGNILQVRTFERGVEAETPACGTGIVASSLAAWRVGLVRPPVRVQSAGGDCLTVQFEVAPDGSAGRVRLAGPAEHVFEGWFER